MVPMYPKNKVYSDPNTEYSIEEIRGQRYRERQKLTVEESELLGVELMQESCHEVSIFFVYICNVLYCFF